MSQRISPVERHTLPLGRAVARDDVAEFDAFYWRYHRQVYAYMYIRTGREEDAADLTQQVFLEAMEGLHHFRGGDGQFPAWLFRIARNKRIDFLRRRRTRLVRTAIPLGDEPVSADNPEADVVHGEALARLRVMVLALEPRKRELLALRFAADLTVPQIAAVIGKGEAATRQELYRIIKSLKERWDE